MTVSVVIPVYNVKPYLERCVNSVLRQTYKDLEIIIVDDGSTDGSAELCDELAKKDERIVLIHQENQGLSGARNTGIRHATGEYVVFLDADDAWMTNDGLEQILKKNSPKHDLIIFKCVDFLINGNVICSADYDEKLLCKFPDVQAVFLHLVRTQRLSISACFLLVRRDILADNQLFFYKGIISEDLSWNLHLWQYVQTVLFVNLDFYGYYHRDNSITTKIANTLHAYHSYDKIFSYWEEECNHGCVNAVAIRIFLADMWVSRGYCYHKLPSSEKPEALAVLKRHTRILKYAETPKARRTACLLNIIGVKSTIFLLGVYWRLRMVVLRHKKNE